MSKGDNRRPAAVPDAVVAENWRRIFGTARTAEYVTQAEKLRRYVAELKAAKAPLLSPHTESKAA